MVAARFFKGIKMCIRDRGGTERAIEVDMRRLVPGVLEGDEIAVQFPQDVGFLFAEGGEAVSYTHLDVYKRQISSWVSPRNL